MVESIIRYPDRSSHLCAGTNANAAESTQRCHRHVLLFPGAQHSIRASEAAPEHRIQKMPMSISQSSLRSLPIFCSGEQPDPRSPSKRHQGICSALPPCRPSVFHGTDSTCSIFRSEPSLIYILKVVYAIKRRDQFDFPKMKNLIT
ncbi:hypothetical protein OF001_U190055 [Pseudomonas sp. OF001]|nr:hypothetical protein OF001_U190055 [Pseudomonas sp. OF001]